MLIDIKRNPPPFPFFPNEAFDYVVEIINSFNNTKDVPLDLLEDLYIKLNELFQVSFWQGVYVFVKETSDLSCSMDVYECSLESYWTNIRSKDKNKPQLTRPLSLFDPSKLGVISNFLDSDLSILESLLIELGMNQNTIQIIKNNVLLLCQLIFTDIQILTHDYCSFKQEVRTKKQNDPTLSIYGNAIHDSSIVIPNNNVALQTTYSNDLSNEEEAKLKNLEMYQSYKATKKISTEALLGASAGVVVASILVYIYMNHLDERLDDKKK